MLRTILALGLIIALSQVNGTTVPAFAQSDLNKSFKNTLDGLFGAEKKPTKEQANDNAVASEERALPTSRSQIIHSYAPLVKKVAPAVVNVYAARKVVERSPFDGDPFFERFFGRNGLNRPRRRSQNSLGSGVIVDKSGIIITNHHVIKGADEVKVALADGREFDCDILLKDEKSDMAVLRVKEKQIFPTIPIGDSDDLQVGDLILAIGNPFGVGQTVTSGIISALARSRVGISDFGFFIQTDAAINPGNSGGALVDMNGNLVGINTAIFTKSGGSHGIGFAVPSNMASVVLKASIAGGDHLTRPWVGASFQNLTSDLAENLGLKRPRGAIVVAVNKAGPAHKAGIRRGDVVLAVNDKLINHPDALGFRLATIGIGNVARLTVLSKEKRKTVEIKLSAAPETTPREEILLKGRNPFSGAIVANLSPAVAEELGLDSAKTGVVVSGIKVRSFAQRYGLLRKDIIRNINGDDVKKTVEIEQFLKSRERIWEFVVERNGRLLRRVVR